MIPFSIPFSIRTLSRGSLGALLGGLGAILGGLRAILGALGAILSGLGAILGALGAILGDLGALLGWSWALLGRSWAILGRSWAVLGRSWPVLGRSKIDQKIDPTLDSKTGRIATEKNGPNTTPVVVSELDKARRKLDAITRKSYQNRYRYD